RPILDLAERARDLATQLGGYLSGAVSKRGVAVDHAPYRLGEGHRLALRLAGDVAQAVHERHVRVVQVLGGSANRLVDRRGRTVHERVGKRPLRSVVLEPRIAKAAGVLRLENALAIGVQLDVVAHASAKGTGRVLDNVQRHVRVQPSTSNSQRSKLFVVSC